MAISRCNPLPALSSQKPEIMLERTQTINGVEYSYQYGGNGTISVTAPIQVVIDLKQMPKLSLTLLGDVSDEQRAHFDGALQAIVADMFAQIPNR
jgi:hypothetical protein